MNNIPIKIYDYNNEPFNEERLKELVFQIRTLSNCMADKNEIVEQFHKQLHDIEKQMYKGLDEALKKMQNGGLNERKGL